MPVRKISSRDVAQKAGLSQTTVSYVLNGREDVAIPAATRQRVLEAARELGYRVNSSARTMRSGRFGTVALLLSENPAMSLLPAERREGILDALEARGMHLLLSRFSDSTLTDHAQMPRILQELRADGLLINYNANLPEQMAELIAQNAIPAVWMNSRQPADCVFPNDQDAGRRATEYLLSLGHRRIAFAIHSVTGHYSYTDRKAGYAAAMRKAGYPSQELRLWTDLPQPLRAEMPLDWLQGETSVTAILAYSPDSVVPLTLAAVSRGLSIPGDLSLLTFAAHPPDMGGASVGTLLLPEREIGRRSAELLLRKIEDPAQTFPPVALPLELTAGDTCAAPQRR